MTLCRQLLLCALLGQGMLLSNANAQTFVVGDRTNEFRNSSIRIGLGGLREGDSISFQGNINGIRIDPVLSGLTLKVEPGAEIFGNQGYAVRLGNIHNPTPAFDGLFTNSGVITATGPSYGIDVVNDIELTGRLVNFGTIHGETHGLILDNHFIGHIELAGVVENFGAIIGELSNGLSVFGDVSGFIINHGLIRSTGRNSIGGGDGVFVDTLSGSLINHGLISGILDGVYIDYDLNGTLENTGTITGLNEDGIDVDRDFNGTFVNRGLIEGRGSSHEGFEVDRFFAGTALNYGLIRGADDAVNIGDLQASGVFKNFGTLMGADDAFDVNNNFSGRAENFGSVLGAVDGFDVDGIFSGEFFNCGIIEAGVDGFSIATGTGTIHNHGGRIQGGGNAISFGGGNGRVILSGPSHIIGEIDGGSGTGDVLRFQNIRGVSAEKEAELMALAASDPNAGMVTLFGELINWVNIEDIQIDASTLDSYESLLSGSGLGGYGASLDQISGLDDELRNFLKGLNDFSRSELNRAASNASGQSLKNSMADLRRERDTNFFNLLSNQFSSLRGDGSGSDPSVQSSGFLSQEVEIGAMTNPVDPEVDTWISSYVGSGKQDENELRSSADYDQTSILFGRGRELNEHVWLGFFGGYSRGEGQVDSFGSFLNTDGAWAGVNALLRNGNAFAALAAGLGFQEIDTARRDFLGNLHEGDTEAFGGFFYAQVGRDLFFGDEGNGKLTPYAGFTYGGDSTSAFSESGPGVSRLRLQDDSDSVIQTMLGVSVAGQSDTGKGWIRPRADLAWWRSYGGDSFEVGTANSSILNNFIVASPAANQNRFVIQAGVEMGLDSLKGWTFEAGYLGVFGEDDYSSHGGTFGARVKF